MLALRAEREVRQEKEALALVAEQAIDKGIVDFSDPDLQAGLRAQVEAGRVADSERYFRLREAELRRQAFGDESAKQLLDNDRAAMAQVEAFLAGTDGYSEGAAAAVVGHDAFLDHPAYRAHEAALAEQTRAIAAARHIASLSRSVLDDAVEAEAGVAEMAAAVLAATDAKSWLLTLRLSPLPGSPVTTAIASVLRCSTRTPRSAGDAWLAVRRVSRGRSRWRQRRPLRLTGGSGS